MQKIQGQGYIGLGGDDVVAHDSDEVLEGEEEGNGRAIAEAMDEEHVSGSLCEPVLGILGRWTACPLSWVEEMMD